jgi:tetratricopeptide (TPR) repeat protein
MVAQDAVRCLELAQSYLTEIEDSVDSLEGNESLGRQMMKTVDLAMKQIDTADRLDASAQLDGADVAYFRARAFGDKGMVENLGLGKRAAAIASLKRSLEYCDDVAMTHYAIGGIYAQSGNKEQAISHLQRAVELEPDNVEYRKLLDRLENVSGVGLRASAFRGSWKTLLILGGLSFVGLLILLAGQVGGGLFFLLVFGGAAFAYWKLKSR